METKNIENQIEKFVRRLYEVKFPAWRTFHNINHTERVVAYCKAFADYYNLDERSRFELVTAAWFHDTGYYKSYQEHEKESSHIALGFLTQFEIQSASLKTIKNLILATRRSATPSTLLEKILCDCDMSHLGSPNYQTWALKLKREFEVQGGCHKTENKWNEENISFFHDHQFFTSYAEDLWKVQKERNLSRLKHSAIRGQGTAIVF
jgi:predicted metal-dependent HD superfamily phosphohydrolase